MLKHFISMNRMPFLLILEVSRQMHNDTAIHTAMP